MNSRMDVERGWLLSTHKVAVARLVKACKSPTTTCLGRHFRCARAVCVGRRQLP